MKQRRAMEDMGSLGTNPLSPLTPGFQITIQGACCPVCGLAIPIGILLPIPAQVIHEPESHVIVLRYPTGFHG